MDSKNVQPPPYNYRQPAATAVSPPPTAAEKGAVPSAPYPVGHYPPSPYQAGQCPPGPYPTGQYPSSPQGGQYPPGQCPPGPSGQVCQPATGQQYVVVNQPLTLVAEQAPLVNPPQDYMVSAIVAIFCCFWPLALVALFRAKSCRDAVATGNRQAANRFSAEARVWLIYSVVVGVIIFVIVGVLSAIYFSTIFSFILTKNSIDDAMERHREAMADWDTSGND